MTHYRLYFLLFLFLIITLLLPLLLVLADLHVGVLFELEDVGEGGQAAERAALGGARRPGAAAGVEMGLVVSAKNNTFL